MKLRTPTFRIELTALSRVDEEDWTRVRVEVQSGGFSGDFESWLQSGDLEVFSKQLAILYENVGQPGEAILRCAERGISISLAMQTMGGIEGEYKFFDERTSALLSGSFNIDQSYIPEWSRRVEDFTEALRQHAL